MYLKLVTNTLDFKFNSLVVMNFLMTTFAYYQ